MAAPASGNVDINRLVSQMRVYKDANRVVKDVANVNKVHRTLMPKRGKLTLNTGQECELLMLEGTLPTHYRGQQYMTPIEIYIPEAYPFTPPTCYVRPVSGMSLKKGHRHVDPSGLVYLPYLHEWTPSSHYLVELCVNMASVFGADPPLFATPSRPTPVPGQTPARPYMANTSPYQYGMPQQRQGAGAGSQHQQQQSPYQYSMPQQRQGPGLGAVPVPALRPLPPTPEDIRKKKEAELTRKMQGELQNMYNKLRTEMDAAFETQCKLEDNEKEVDANTEEVSRRNIELERLLKVGKERLAELDVYLEERAKEGEPAVEDLIEPRDALSQKMLSLVAENAAIEDALYYMDVGVTDGVITVEVFLKEVRRLARKQFVARATMHKVEAAQRKVKSEREALNTDHGRGSGGYYPSLPSQQHTPPGGRGYMNSPPPRYTLNPTGPMGGPSSGPGGYYPSVPPAYGQRQSPWGAPSGRGVGYGAHGYGTQGPHSQR